jgi:hypothetical protein
MGLHKVLMVVIAVPLAFGSVPAVGADDPARAAAEAAERAKRDIAESKDAEARAEAKQQRDAAEAADRAKSDANRDRK